MLLDCSIGSNWIHGVRVNEVMVTDSTTREIKTSLRAFCSLILLGQDAEDNTISP